MRGIRAVNRSWESHPRHMIVRPTWPTIRSLGTCKEKHEHRANITGKLLGCIGFEDLLGLPGVGVVPPRRHPGLFSKGDT